MVIPCPLHYPPGWERYKADHPDLDHEETAATARACCWACSDDARRTTSAQREEP